VNANQLFGWRRLYLQGRLEPANRETPGLLAVRVVEGVREAARRRNASAASGTIQIELPEGRVRIVEIVDQTSLHTVLELCFAKILCAPKIARFPAATAVLSFAKTPQDHDSLPRNNVTGLSTCYSFQTHS